MSQHHGLLGTVVELRVLANDSVAKAVERSVIGEIGRLQSVFNVYDDHSNLRRWLAGEMAPTPELARVLSLAEEWRARSRRAFDPAVGSLVTLWEEGAMRDEVPDASEVSKRVDELVGASLASLANHGVLINLNAVAKGWIVDRVVEAAFAFDGLVGLTVNAGGDLRHRSPDPIVVGIEDPRRPFDNVPPLMRVSMNNGALATSGGARRGWRIGGRWFSHVIDPRTGYPVDHISSASVMAPDVASADAIATVLTVLRPEEGCEFAGEFEDVGCCIVARDGTILRNEYWESRELRED